AAGVRRLVVVPNRGLHMVPLASWWQRVGRRRWYVVDEFEVCTAPSLTLLGICDERAGRREVSTDRTVLRPLALLDPTGDLPMTRLDALTLSPALTPDQILAGDQVTAD